MAKWLATKIDVTPAAAAYNDVDCSAHVPEGSTAAIVEVSADALNRNFWLRKKGSTDDYYSYVEQEGSSHSFHVVGLDGDGTFQAKIESGITLHLVGALGDEFTALTNVQQLPLAHSGTQNIDLTAYCPGAAGAMILGSATDTNWWTVYPKGSSGPMAAPSHAMSLPVKLDVLDEFSCYEASANIRFWLVGYWGSGAGTFHDGALSGDTVGAAYEDLSFSPGENKLCWFKVGKDNGTNNYQYALRPESGGPESAYLTARSHTGAACASGADGKVEAKASNVACNFWLYATLHTSISGSLAATDSDVDTFAAAGTIGASHVTGALNAVEDSQDSCAIAMDITGWGSEAVTPGPGSWT